MLGSYPEISGFKNAVESAQQREKLSDYISQQLDLPLEFDPDFSSVYGCSSEFNAKFGPWINDFILVAEFSELEGPLPIITYPKYGGKVLNMNALVVKLLAVDYQSFSGSHSCISDDVQVIQQEILPGVNAFVNYFTLCDIRARGFVRVLCIAYLTSDFFKLQHLINNLRISFLQVSRLLKYGNFLGFDCELKQLMSNLMHTKECHGLWLKEEKELLEELSPRELTILSQLNIESLNNQIKECKKIQDQVTEKLNDSWSRDIVNHWSSLMKANHDSNIFICMSNICHSWCFPLQPPEILCTNGPHRLNAINYRDICMLSGWSSIPALYALYELQELFALPFMDLVLREIDFSITTSSGNEESPFQGYSIGFSVMYNASDSLVRSSQDTSASCDSYINRLVSPQNELQIKYILQNLPFSSLFSRERIYDVPCCSHVTVDGKDADDKLTLCCYEVEDFSVFTVQTSSKLCLKHKDFLKDLYCCESSVEGPNSDQTATQLPKSILFLSAVDFVQCHLSLSKSELMLKFLNKFSDLFAHLIHCLLMGRTVILGGSDKAKKEVCHYVDLLKIFVPATTVKCEANVLRWHRGTIIQYHLEKYKLIGLCIPERLHIQDVMSNATLNMVTILDVESHKIIGPAYHGKYICGLENWTDNIYVSEKAFLYYLWGIFSDITQSLYVFKFLKSHSKIRSGDLLNALSIDPGDKSIIKYLRKICRVISKKDDISPEFN